MLPSCFACRRTRRISALQWQKRWPVEREAMGKRGRGLFAQRFEIGAAARELRYLLVTLSDGSA